MGSIYLRFAFGLACGVILGLIFPAWASWWLLLIFFGDILASELIGRWGFGAHWSDYRFSSFILYTCPIIFVLIGILLGSGKIGTLLIALGTLMSR